MDMFHHCTCHRDEIPDQTTKQAPNQPGFVHTAQQTKSKFMLLNDFLNQKDYLMTRKYYLEFKFRCP